MRAAFALAAVIPAAAAVASQPVGGTHGAWHVTAVGSLSGVSGNDAAVSLTQESGGTVFEARWYQEQGRAVRVWYTVRDCSDGEDMSAGYDVPTDRWLATTVEVLTRQIGRDLEAW